MTYLEQESLEYRSRIKNDYDKGYDDCMNNKKPSSDTRNYLNGYGYAYELKEKQSVGNN